MWKTYLGKRLLGFKYATKGAWMLLRNEASIQVQAVVAIGITIAGFYFHISTSEWIAQTLAIGMVMSIEGLNTAAEEIANFVHPDFHDKIGYIKDVAAGAVFFAAIVAVIVACLIYIPKF
ncbi:MAG: diacylglycerol kinase family protein [Bacteroidia bacterium]|nr:diacylglycerol kinase family protein [Bacteroidia bacterium]NNF31271.1 diacylglycerol kinase family protein [Flavobacteriaceae bacterium]MBT8275897.1 diacylglycerol kinase family protein [Bacteroidia bacterium]NNJ82956.1 diacylglycerol kinase family protein [Flavobacteriaceae bacterium]NNK54534.1 diacylglycerol kinase family protein [Flavobacteriaceae bacterium]